MAPEANPNGGAACLGTDACIQDWPGDLAATHREFSCPSARTQLSAHQEFHVAALTAQRLTLGGANGDGEEAVHRAIRPRDHRAVMY